ncbi:MAG: hypothetical protein ACK5Y2_00785 [Bdellovibrionales bacterium]
MLKLRLVSLFFFTFGLVGLRESSAQSHEEFNAKMYEALFVKKKVAPATLKEWRIRFQTEVNAFKALTSRRIDPTAVELQKTAWYFAFANHLVKSSGREVNERILAKYHEIVFRRDPEAEVKVFEDIERVYSEETLVQFLGEIYRKLPADDLPPGAIQATLTYCAKFDLLKNVRIFEECRLKQLSYAFKNGAAFERLKQGVVKGLLHYYMTPPVEIPKLRGFAENLLKETGIDAEFRELIRATVFFAELAYGDKEKALAQLKIIQEASQNDERKQRLENFRLLSDGDYERLQKILEKTPRKGAKPPVISNPGDLQLAVHLYYRLGDLMRARAYARERLNAMMDSESVLLIPPLLTLLLLNHKTGNQLENPDYEALFKRMRKSLSQLRSQNPILADQMDMTGALLKNSLTLADLNRLKKLAKRLGGTFPSYANPLDFLQGLEPTAEPIQPPAAPAPEPEPPVPSFDSEAPAPTT